MDINELTTKIAGENAHQLNIEGRQALSEGKIGEAVKLSLQSIGEQIKYTAGTHETSEDPSSGLSTSVTKPAKSNLR